MCAVVGAVLHLPLSRLRAIEKEAVKLRYRCSRYAHLTLRKNGRLADVFYTRYFAQTMPRLYPFKNNVSKTTSSLQNKL